MVVLAQKTVNLLMERFSQLPDVEAVIRLPILPQEYDDPIFSLKLDVFITSNLPDYNQRKNLIPDAKFFEASRRKPKDRFFWNNLPVHVEYKLCRQWEELMTLIKQSDFHWDGSTYPLFRMAEGIVLKDVSGWIHRQKDALYNLPGSFFVVHLGLLRDRLEHLTSDLAIATYLKDNVMFEMTMGKYLETLTEAWFTMEKSFMPPFDQIQTRLKQLEYLPEGAWGVLDVLTRPNIDLDRRLEVAKKATYNVG